MHPVIIYNNKNLLSLIQRKFYHKIVILLIFKITHTSRGYWYFTHTPDGNHLEVWNMHLQFGTILEFSSFLRYNKFMPLLLQISLGATILLLNKFRQSIMLVSDTIMLYVIYMLEQTLQLQTNNNTGTSTSLLGLKYTSNLISKTCNLMELERKT